MSSHGYCNAHFDKRSHNKLTKQTLSLGSNRHMVHYQNAPGLNPVWGAVWTYTSVPKWFIKSVVV